MGIVRAFLGLGALQLATACSQPLDEVWQLSRYRVLGVRTEPAEANPSDALTLTLASADNAVREVTTVWFLCDQRISAFASASGGASDGGVFGGCPTGHFQLDSGPVAHFTAPLSGGGTLDELGRELYSVIGFSCAGGTIDLPTTESNGLPRCSGTNASGTMFVRSVYVRAAGVLGPPNQNPAITEVRFGQPGATQVLGASDLPAVPTCQDQRHHVGCTPWQFEVGFDAPSRETYRAPDPLSGVVRSLTERLTVSYLVSAGTLDGGFRADSVESPTSTMANTWYAPDRPGAVDVWVYGNDGRGGFDFTVRHVRVR